MGQPQSEGASERPPIPESVQNILANAKDILAAVYSDPRTSIETGDDTFTITKQKQVGDAAWGNLPRLLIKADSLPGYAIVITNLPFKTDPIDIYIAPLDQDGTPRTRAILANANPAALTQGISAPSFTMPWLAITDAQTYSDLPHEVLRPEEDNYSPQAHVRILADVLAYAKSSLEGNDNTQAINKISIAIPNNATARLEPAVAIPDLPPTTVDGVLLIPALTPSQLRPRSASAIAKALDEAEKHLQENRDVIEATYRIEGDADLTARLIQAAAKVATGADTQALIYAAREGFVQYLNYIITLLVSDAPSQSSGTIMRTLNNIAPCLKAVFEKTPVPELTLPDRGRFDSLKVYMTNIMQARYEEKYRSKLDERARDRKDEERKQKWKSDFSIMMQNLTKLHQLGRR